MKAIRRIIIALLLILISAIVFVLLFATTEDLPLHVLKEKYENDKSKYVNIDGVNIHYRIEGEGSPLILLHGTSSSLHTWDGWVDQLKDSFQLIRLDLPAFGLTGPNPSGDYSIDYYVNFLNQFLNGLNVESFSIAGNSLGGYIAWLYTLRHPESVEKLILIDASGYPMNSPTIIKLAKKPILNTLMSKVTPRILIENNILEVYEDDSKVTEQLIDRYYDLIRRPGNRDAFIKLAQNSYKNHTDSLAFISTPTLILWGEEDAWIPLDYSLKFNTALSNVSLITYQGVGHLPMEEIPTISAHDVQIFLNKRHKNGKSSDRLIIY